MSKSSKINTGDNQGKLFIEAARELGCDEDPARFEEKLKKVAAHKPIEPPPSPKKTGQNKPAK